MSGEPRALIFDFDGVILESADIKTHAFARLFEEHSDHLEAIVELHLRLAGVSRYEKFRLIHETILRRPIDDAEVARLGTQFSEIVLEEILGCPFVPGAREFLEQRHRTQDLHVASGTPEEELRVIVRERGLERYFSGVYGTPAVKGDIARRILKEMGCDPREAIFVGDATADLEGARVAGIPFVGRVRPGDPNPFESEPVPVVEDLHELGRRWSTLPAELGIRQPA